MRNTQAKVARFDILWSFVASGPQPANPADPNDPAYDWTRCSGADRLDQANITPIGTYSTPTFAVDGRNTKFPGASTTRTRRSRRPTGCS